MSTLFGRKSVAVRPKIIKGNINQEPKKRKKRSDAKSDIKFKLSADEKKVLQIKAMNHRLSLTAFVSLVVSNDLLLKKEYKQHEYDNEGEFVHVVLDQDDFNQIQSLKIEWSMSYRKVVHRIIKEYLWKEKYGITIYSAQREG